ncbi:hypothetical protein L486_00656 [Kwoniella mangroviensis CBS 10435]|uniref:DUF7719 domain-containing protein n=1 Tax=Kwoniella mangroviensis CBS 10435 TaxID=1331196 RepID=A0A1B9IZT3_9TREE|nr:uncharacterized protein I203_04187 [Kwoniella mangroviensis CBS 8507]OCF61012.1 hypothetical protein L486_00656 [Kwoniella mangroviensis CBS 10435]OCF66611.1 hypothetical protein I203_04187 [Kwoniella mangroviensis CBS 8507]OCF74240.1 hypothetical protein I204_04610 [Kwoniella mangroviensis CBS 8886]
MAIVEEIPSSPNPISNQSSSTRQRKNKSKSKTNKEDPSLAIPLRKPSSSSSSANTKPLIDVDLPENSSIYTLNPGETISPDHLSNNTTEEQEQQEEDGDDEIFNTLILVVPFTFLYLLLDILVHLQYNHRPDKSDLMKGCIVALPTNRHASHWITNSFLISASLISGCRLIYLVNTASWSVVTAEAPPMGTLWILTIVQLPLSRAVLALGLVGGWIWWKGMKLMP